MKHDLEGIRSALSDYDIDTMSRPDGSVVLTVKHRNRHLTRVVDANCSTDEVIRLIKFDMTLDEDGHSINEAVKYCCSSTLPTYSREPIFRTRNSRLWALRKLKTS